MKLLGDEWHAESGYWGVTGEITTLDGVRFIVGMDHEGAVAGPAAATSSTAMATSGPPSPGVLFEGDGLGK